MKKRLRKKKHFGEFREYGFTIIAELNVGNSDPECEPFFDDLIEFVENNNLGIGGGINNKVDVFCTRLGRGTCTEEDRKTVAKWLEDNALVTKFKVGALVDAWHADDKDYDLEF